MIMVTHNPDLECYANRILYIKNGMVDKQVINQYQCKYYPEEYQEKVNSKKLLFFFFFNKRYKRNKWQKWATWTMEELTKLTHRAKTFIEKNKEDKRILGIVVKIGCCDIDIQLL